MTIPAGVSFRPLSRGDIVLATFPYSSLASSKRRPAVIVAQDASAGDYTLAFVTSQQTGSVGPAEIAVPTSHPEFSLTGLTVSSKIRPVKMVTLARSLLTRRLGKLGPLLTAGLDHALVIAFSVDVTVYQTAARFEERSRLVELQGSLGTSAVLTDLGPAPST